MTATGGYVYLTKDEDKNGNAITYNYVAGTAQLSSIVDTQGRTFNVGYTSGNLSSISSSGLTPAMTWTYHWDANDNIDYYTDPTGATVNYGYNANAKLSQLTTDRGDAVGFTWNSEQVDTITQTADNANPGTTTYTTSYAVHVPAGSFCGSLTDRTSAIGCTVVTDANGNVMKYAFDVRDRIVRVRDGLDHARSTDYSTNDDVSQIYGDSLSPVAQLGYATDGTNNLTSAQLQTGATTAFGYTDTNNPYQPNSMTDDRGKQTLYTYDDSSPSYTQQLSQVSDPDGRLTKYNYQGDSASTTCTGAKKGQLCKITDANNNVTTYLYNNGDLTKITPPSPLGATNITPDNWGRIASLTDGKGQKTTYSYDNLGRVTQLLLAGTTVCNTGAGTCLTYSYDGDGSLTTRVDKTGTTTFGYDNMNRATSKTMPGSVVSSVTYDGVGNILTYTDPGGTVTYGYDAANRVTKLAEPGGSCPATPTFPNSTKCTGFGYDVNNNRTSVTYPSNEKITLGYDAANRETSVTAKRPSGTTIQARTYTYAEPATSSDTSLVWTVVNGSTTTAYGYDNERRLISKANNGVTTDTYTYDNVGNRLTWTNATTTYYKYNAANELCWSGLTSGASCGTVPTGDTAYTFDANGNLTAAGSTSYTYNAANQTTAIGGVAMAYADIGQNERISAGTTTYATGLLGLQSLASGGTTQYFTRDPHGGLIGMRTGAGGSSTNNYYTLNLQQSVMALTNSAGTTDTDTRTYDAFGKASGGTASASPYRFGTGIDAGAASLLKMGTRYYDPNLGRWTQQDPVPGLTANPGGLNRYPYVSNNPQSRIDPSGTLSIGDVLDATSDSLSAAADFLDSGAGEIISDAVGCLSGTVVFVEAAAPLEAAVTAFTTPVGGAIVTGIAAASGCLAGIFIDAPGAV